jgi:hypothetical protein
MGQNAAPEKKEGIMWLYAVLSLESASGRCLDNEKRQDLYMQAILIKLSAGSRWTIRYQQRWLLDESSPIRIW